MMTLCALLGHVSRAAEQSAHERHLERRRDDDHDAKQQRPALNALIIVLDDVVVAAVVLSTPRQLQQHVAH